ncbi:hypothetical protein C4J81_13530 [Deltaproteobacteria bacterium Smac51]|nr:hypothetical protein C4J81_13530 [Deltaproteobacteria bacterium Smac51]
MKRNFIGPLLVCAATLALFLGGCSGDDKGNEAASGGGAADKNAPAIDETDKWNAYVSLSNELHKDFLEAYNAYLEAFGSDETFRIPDDEKGQKLAGEFRRVASHVSNMKKPLEEVARVSTAEPQNDLDKAATALEASLSPMLEAMLTMREYLQNKEYIDDNYAKAAELHKTFMTNSAGFEAALPPFTDQIDAMEPVMREKSMKEMREQGQKIRPEMLSVLMAGEKILVYLDEKGLNAENFHSLNIDEFRPLYSAMGEAIKKLEEVATDEQAEAESLHMGSLKDYISVAKETRTQAAAMIENVLEKKNPHSTWGSGTPEKYSKSFDLLISRYNSYIN